MAESFVRFGEVWLKIEADDAAVRAVWRVRALEDGTENELSRRAARELAEYFAGRRRAFDLPLRPAGTEFQRAVWAALQEVPFGEKTSYGELAEKLGRPAAARAVGGAVGKNPLLVLIPCHRVLGKDGSLTGFSAGLDLKKALLALEAGREL
jgi:methylated-DNA-[protein]-cysteine S-methyltransferase